MGLRLSCTNPSNCSPINRMGNSFQHYNGKHHVFPSYLVSTWKCNSNVRKCHDNISAQGMTVNCDNSCTRPPYKRLQHSPQFTWFIGHLSEVSWMISAAPFYVYILFNLKSTPCKCKRACNGTLYESNITWQKSKLCFSNWLAYMPPTSEIYVIVYGRVSWYPINCVVYFMKPTNIIVFIY